MIGSEEVGKAPDTSFLCCQRTNCPIFWTFLREPCLSTRFDTTRHSIPRVAVAMSSPSPAYAPYQPNRSSQSFDPNAPPAPPPKPSSQEVSRRSTPAGTQSLIPPPPAQKEEPFGTLGGVFEDPQLPQQARMREAAYAQHSQDPGEQWLPKILEDKSYVMLLHGLLEYQLTSSSPANKISPIS